MITSKVILQIINGLDLPKCLILGKPEFLNAVYDFKLDQKNKRFNFLQNVKFFQDNWTLAKTGEFNNLLQEFSSSFNEGKYII